MNECEQAIPLGASGFPMGDTWSVGVYLGLALLLMVALPILAVRGTRTGWAPRWADARAADAGASKAARFAWAVDALTLAGVALAALTTWRRLQDVTSHTQSPPHALAAAHGRCLPPYISGVGFIVSALGVWVFLWVLRRSLRGPERLSFFGGAPAWVSASYAYFGLFSVGSAWLYYLVTLDLLPAQPLARALGALAYESQSPMHMAPFVFALVELGCRRSRPVSRLALRMTLWTLGGVAAGFVVGMEWPLSRVLEVLANTIALLHGAALLRAGAVRDDAPRAADQEPAAA